MKKEENKIEEINPSDYSEDIYIQMLNKINELVKEVNQLKRYKKDLHDTLINNKLNEKIQ
jgi:HAMP domain-containing protein